MPKRDKSRSKKRISQNIEKGGKENENKKKEKNREKLGKTRFAKGTKRERKQRRQ